MIPKDSFRLYKKKTSKTSSHLSVSCTFILTDLFQMIPVCPTCSSSRRPPFCPLHKLLLIPRGQSCFLPQELCRPLCRPSSKHRFGEGLMLTKRGAPTSSRRCIVPRFLLPTSDGSVFDSSLSTAPPVCLSAAQVGVRVSGAQKAC